MDDLHIRFSEVIGRSESLLLRYFEGFDIFAWTDNDDKFLRRKAFAELSLYLSIAQTDDQFPKDLRPLADLTTTVTNSDGFHRLMLRHQKEFLLFSSPILFCNYIDRLTETTRQVVGRILNGRQVWSLERAPHRMMDMWHFCQAYGFAQSILLPCEIMRFGVPNFIDVINSNLRDAYAFTHHFLFYYNFGVPHRSFPTTRMPVMVGPSVNGLILRYISERNCDIVAELMLVGLLHDQIDPVILYFATGWLLERVAKFGFVPGPGVKDENISESDWKNHYHTILVSAAMFRLAGKSSQFQQSAAQIVGDEEATFFREIGDVYNMLARNELPFASVSLGEIARPRDFEELFETAVQHIKGLEYTDGEFGFLADEETVFLRTGKTKAEFQVEIARPLNLLCIELLAGLGKHDNARALGHSHFRQTQLVD